MNLSMLIHIAIALLSNISTVLGNIGSIRIENLNEFKRPSRRHESSYWYYQSKNTSVYAFQGDKSKMLIRFFIEENIADTGVSLYAIFDGNAGDFSVNSAVKNLIESLEDKIEQIKKIKKKKSAPEDLRKYLLKAKQVDYGKLLTDEILSFDKNLVQELRKIGDLSGTTALVAIIDGRKLHIANVGDSRAILSNRKEKVTILSNVHKPKVRLEEKRIKDAGGVIDFDSLENIYLIDGLRCSRILGDFLVKSYDRVIAEPETFSYDLTKLESKFIVLASDGVWDGIGDTEAVDIINGNIDDELFGAKAVADKAYESRSPYSMAIIIIKTIQESPIQAIKKRNWYTHLPRKKLARGFVISIIFRLHRPSEVEEMANSFLKLKYLEAAGVIPKPWIENLNC